MRERRPVGQFLLPDLEPRQHLAFEEAAQALGIGGGRLFTFSKLVWRRERRLPMRRLQPTSIQDTLPEGQAALPPPWPPRLT
jgi:hypothetical protein